MNEYSSTKGPSVSGGQSYTFWKKPTSFERFRLSNLWTAIVVLIASIFYMSSTLGYVLYIRAETHMPPCLDDAFQYINVSEQVWRDFRQKSHTIVSLREYLDRSPEDLTPLGIAQQERQRHRVYPRHNIGYCFILGLLSRILGGKPVTAYWFIVYASHLLFGLALYFLVSRWSCSYLLGAISLFPAVFYMRSSGQGLWGTPTFYSEILFVFILAFFFPLKEWKGILSYLPAFILMIFGCTIHPVFYVLLFISFCAECMLTIIDNGGASKKLLSPILLYGAPILMLLIADLSFRIIGIPGILPISDRFVIPQGVVTQRHWLAANLIAISGLFTNFPFTAQPILNKLFIGIILLVSLFLALGGFSPINASCFICFSAGLWILGGFIPTPLLPGMFCRYLMPNLTLSLILGVCIALANGAIALGIFLKKRSDAETSDERFSNRHSLRYVCNAICAILAVSLLVVKGRDFLQMFAHSSHPLADRYMSNPAEIYSSLNNNDSTRVLVADEVSLYMALTWLHYNHEVVPVFLVESIPEESEVFHSQAIFAYVGIGINPKLEKFTSTRRDVWLIRNNASLSDRLIILVNPRTPGLEANVYVSFFDNNSAVIAKNILPAGKHTIDCPPKCKRIHLTNSPSVANIEIRSISEDPSGGFHCDTEKVRLIYVGRKAYLSTKIADKWYLFPVEQTAGPFLRAGPPIRKYVLLDKQEIK